MALRLLMLGPPGAGKGTQAVQIARDHGVPKISTGDMLRDAVTSGSELGRQVKETVARGQLVSDDLIVELVRRRLADDDARGGFVLDGFPRTVPQAEALERMLTRAGRRIDDVVLLEVPDELIVERITGRRTGETSGRIYHIKYDPPPFPDRGEGGERLVVRDDDREEKVRTRLVEYSAMTAPLVAWYGSKGLLRRVDGVGLLDDVTAALFRSIGVA